MTVAERAMADDREQEPSARAWTRATFENNFDSLVFRISNDAVEQIDAALNFARANGLTAETVEQEDFRIPAFAADIPELRRRLDDGRGMFILRGLELGRYSESDAEMIAWALGNYMGRPMRQGLAVDRRLFTVTDRGAANTDPTRIGASARRSAMHSDNGCLEPRPPCYVGLFCCKPAAAGGESMIVSARTLHDVIERERPDLLPLYYQSYHFRPPELHVWPAGEPTIRKPIFETLAGELRIHYARVMIEPGMEIAGTPLDRRQREALDYLDRLLERPGLYVEYALAPGEMLFTNNLVLLHGRAAFRTDAGGGRILKRIWLWRRHLGPGTDPAALDMAELG